MELHGQCPNCNVPGMVTEDSPKCPNCDFGPCIDCGEFAELDKRSLCDTCGERLAASEEARDRAWERYQLNGDRY